VNDSQAVNLVLASDRNALWGLAVTVRSALEHCSTTCNVLVLGTDLREQDEQALADSWQTPNIGWIRFIHNDVARFDGLRPMMNLPSKTCYARLFLDEYLPDATRCIYLDVDLLVSDDLSTLQTMDMQGCIAAAANDVSAGRADLQGIRHRELGLARPEMYFNSGVLLIDLARWRQFEVGRKALEYSKANYDLVRAQDQDALNVILEGRWLLLDERWNISQYAPASLDHRGVVHLIGRAKPWHADYDGRFRGMFYDMLDRTAFAGRRPMNPLGLGALAARLGRKVPTFEMIRGKLRRELAKRFGTSMRAAAAKQKAS
jgi:lipopolysaccharide biosynthesis glycosyltransferase